MQRGVRIIEAGRLQIYKKRKKKEKKNLNTSIFLETLRLKPTSNRRWFHKGQIKTTATVLRPKIKCSWFEFEASCRFKTTSHVYALLIYFIFLSVINFTAMTKQTRVKLSPHNPRWRLLSKPATRVVNGHAGVNFVVSDNSPNLRRQQRLSDCNKLSSDECQAWNKFINPFKKKQKKRVDWKLFSLIFTRKVAERLKKRATFLSFPKMESV